MASASDGNVTAAERRPAITTLLQRTRVLQLLGSGYDCAGVCLNDADADGICDEFEVAGTASACNTPATDDDGSCSMCRLDNVRWKLPPGQR